MCESTRPPRKTGLAAWGQRVESLQVETRTLYLACGDPRTPWYAKVCALGVVAYALSPIDLIPDFIPVLGYLDDLLIVPLGIWLTIRMVPPEVLADCRRRADVEMQDRTSVGQAAAVIVVLIWILLALLIGMQVWRLAAHWFTG